MTKSKKPNHISLLKKFVAHCHGNVMVGFALSLLPLSLGVGAAIEITSAMGDEQLLQDAADAGALAGATKLNVASTDQTGLGAQSLAQSVALKHISGSPNLSDATFHSEVDLNNGTVSVTGAVQRRSVFEFVGEGVFNLKVRAVAEVQNQLPLCVLHINKGTFNVSNISRITAHGCMVHSNDSIEVSQSATIYAGKVRAVGEVKGITTPQGQGGALHIPDPFASIDIKPDGVCNEKLKSKLKVSKSEEAALVAGVVTMMDGSYALNPGTHCQELVFDKNSTLTLLPGDHFFINGLTMKGASRLEGNDVTLIFDKYKKFDFDENTTIDLTARKTGPYAGFLIITTRDNTEKFTISSANVDNLLGTIYIPNAELSITAQGDVAEDSAWSVIVAKTITVSASAQVVINKNYSATNVPLPKGVGTATGVRMVN